MNNHSIPIRQQLWQEPVFSPQEGEAYAPTRHQVDCWIAEAKNFPATIDELPYGRREWTDVLATRAYQAGRDSVNTLDSQNSSPRTAPITDSQHTPEKAGDLVPPVKLRCQWVNESPVFGANGVTRIGTDWKSVMTKAAAWGADRELEACCEWLLLNGWGQAINGLRAARRPKPPSIKRQAFDALDAYIYGNPDSGDKQRTYNTIRRALEALPDEH